MVRLPKTAKSSVFYRFTKEANEKEQKDKRKTEKHVVARVLRINFENPNSQSIPTIYIS